MFLSPERPVPATLLTGCLWPTVAGLLAFLGSLVLGLVVTVLAIRPIPPEHPNPTEAYEGFGDYLQAKFWFEMGAGLSFVVAVLIGLMVAAWVMAYRAAPHAPAASH
jgi:hypothetical protein